ncbi:hypothetical protein GCM10011608_19730 [Micromonospora sonchi]|uniref:Uncharacterized protein n=1 Tax=Micromonospora sonchi TaxID=1763543 RepID=A0A917WW39_9ACTN|nr:hypothetical protein GCM10011608_19730 [Micromonospora sonchi]
MLLGPGLPLEDLADVPVRGVQDLHCADLSFAAAGLRCAALLALTGPDLSFAAAGLRCAALLALTMPNPLL